MSRVPIDDEEDPYAGPTADLWTLFYEREFDYDMEAHAVLALLENEGVKGRRVLELGCGTGSFSMALTRQGGQVTAMDRSPAMLRAANKRFEDSMLAVRALSPEELSGAGHGQFDCIIAQRMSPTALEAKALVELAARLLIPGGILFLSSWDSNSHESWLLPPRTLTLDAARSEYLSAARISVWDLSTTPNKWTLVDVFSRAGKSSMAIRQLCLHTLSYGELEAILRENGFKSVRAAPAETGTSVFAVRDSDATSD
jgi:ubiquinone/menaquinone biosynthesis C-methylase UbiE